MSRWLPLLLVLAACEEIEPFYDDSENRACDPRTAWFADTDADGFGNPADLYLGCTQPTGFVTDNTDCNDADATLHVDCPTDTGDTGDTSDTSADSDADSADSGSDTSDSGEPSDTADTDSGV